MNAAIAAQVSVVVPAYNVSEFIGSAIDRLLDQSIPVQVVVVDDASTDDTGRIIDERAAGNSRVTVVSHQVNGGVAAAREMGVRASTAPFVWFVDADDDWPVDAAERLVRAAESGLGAAQSGAADVVCARAEYVFPDGQRKPVTSPPPGTSVDGAEAFRELLVGQISGHLWNKLFARHLFDKIDFTRSAVHSDQAMVAQLLAAAETVVAAEATVYSYRLREGSIIRSDKRRAESLETVGEVIRACADTTGLASSDELAYYTARFSLLSRMKDATSGAYPAAERRTLVRRIRREMSPKVFAALLRERDAQRLALLAAARLNLGLYRLVMKVGGGRR